MTSKPTNTLLDDLIRCPYCAERIQNAAIVCRFCGREVKSSPGGPRLDPGGSRIRGVRLLPLAVACVAPIVLIALGIIYLSFSPGRQAREQAVLLSVRAVRIGNGDLHEMCSLTAILSQVNQDVRWRARPVDIQANRWTVECYAPQTTIGSSSSGNLARVVFSFIYSIPEQRLYIPDSVIADMVAKTVYASGSEMAFVDVSTTPPSIYVKYINP